MKTLMIILMIGLISFGVVNCKDKPDPKHIVKIGDLAPDFVVKYLDGSTAKLSDMKGKVVMLQFTASWCSVCNKEMPFIESEIWQINKSNPDFVLLGVDLKENKETIQKFIKSTKISYPLIFDEEGSIFELYAEKDAGVTRNVLIDRNGKIVYLTRLFDREEFDGLKEKIKEELSRD